MHCTPKRPQIWLQKNVDTHWGFNNLEPCPHASVLDISIQLINAGMAPDNADDHVHAWKWKKWSNMTIDNDTKVATQQVAPDCLPNFSLGVHRKLTQNQLGASPSLSFGDFSKRNLAKQIRARPAKRQWIMQPRYENSPQHSGIPGQDTLSPNAGLLKHLYFLDIDHLMIDTPATALTNADIAMVRRSEVYSPTTL